MNFRVAIEAVREKGKWVGLKKGKVKKIMDVDG
jgi:hypothetical protein